MNRTAFIELMEQRQITIYFMVIAIAIIMALVIPATAWFEVMINPALAMMLLVTFLQVPIAELTRIFHQGRFLATLLCANFLLIPLLVFILMQLLPPTPLLRLGVLLVLLTPCIDYVVTFSYLGKADAKLLLAATPILLVVQMVLLPLYLTLFLGQDVAHIVSITPFIHAFISLILLPFILAVLLQWRAKKNRLTARLVSGLNILPVPATACVLLVIVLAIVPQLSSVFSHGRYDILHSIVQVVPIYLLFAILAPIAGLLISRVFKLEKKAQRAVAFSVSTRNSLVILPLALAIPNGLPLLPVIIVTQTFIELFSEIIYIYLFTYFAQSSSPIK